MTLTTEILKQRGYQYDFDLDRNDHPCHSYHKGELILRDVLGNGELFEVKGGEIDTLEELEAIEQLNK